MLRFVRGDIMASAAQTLVNPVNCVGVMGAGLARRFRARWPAMFDEYRRACSRGRLAPGLPMAWPCGDGRQILCVPTKIHWREPSTLAIVGAGLAAIAERHSEWGVASLALPALGCGLGGLAWPDVRALICDALRGAPFDVDAFEP